MTQSGVTFMQEDEAAATYRRMKKLFADAALYVTQVPTYGAGFMTLGWGCHSAVTTSVCSRMTSPGFGERLARCRSQARGVQVPA